MRQSIYWKVIRKQCSFFLFFFCCNNTWIWNLIVFIALRVALNEADKDVKTAIVYLTDFDVVEE